MREHLDALHEAATKGPVHRVPDAYDVNWVLQNEAGEVLGTAEGHIQHEWHENGEWLEAIHNAWPEISRQLAAVERVRAIIPVLDRARDNGTVLTYGAVQNMIREALDVTP